jgi:hypothetical protein|tara:strand:- start:1160 stop:1369 length:210 start_codon:yes stop_codon:yes gene_type:complete
MKDVSVVQHIFAAWPNTAVMARELAVDYFTCFQWKRRDTIPGRHWPRVLAAYQTKTGQSLDVEENRLSA